MEIVTQGFGESLIADREIGSPTDAHVPARLFFYLLGLDHFAFPVRRDGTC